LHLMSFSKSVCCHRYSFRPRVIKIGAAQKNKMATTYFASRRMILLLVGSVRKLGDFAPRDPSTGGLCDVLEVDQDKFQPLDIRGLKRHR